MKKFFLLFSLALLFLPIGAHATIDLRCFTLADCVKIRQSTLAMSPEAAKDHPLYQGSDTQTACGGLTNKEKEPIGFCYPGSQSQTRVSFGGKVNFTNGGDFIQYMFRVAIIFASIIAVIMIIFAGVQWTASAGNAETVKKAQKRIAGAITGLLIAILSYSILFTLNPYLVNLRLPQAWLISGITPPTEFCRDLPNLDKEKFAFIGDSSAPIDTTKLSALTYPLSFSATDTDKFGCGKHLLPKSGGDATCRGSACLTPNDKAQTCAKEGSTYLCKAGTITGYITNGEVQIPFWHNWVGGVNSINDMELHVVCADGSHHQIDVDELKTMNADETKAEYSLVMTKLSTGAQVAQLCTPVQPLGVLLYPDFDKNWSFLDEPHFIGRKPGSTQAVDLGDKNTPFFDMIKPSAVTPSGKTPAQNFLMPFDQTFNKGGFQLNINLKDVSCTDCWFAK